MNKPAMFGSLDIKRMQMQARSFLFACKAEKKMNKGGKFEPCILCFLVLFALVKSNAC